MQELKQKYLNACLDGNVDMVVDMFRYEPKQFKTEKFLLQCLKRACDGNSMSVCKTIIELVGNKITQRFLLGALGHVCESGRLNFYIFYMKMIDHNSDTTQSYFPGACYSGNMELIEYMIADIYRHRTEVNNYHYGYWDDCLKNACSSGSLKAIKLCIKYGGKKWSYSLVGACSIDNIKIVRFLLNGVSELDDDFHSCLEEACRVGNPKIIELLIKKGANRWNAGLCGACEGGHLQIIELMILKGANHWNSGLRSACRGGHLSIIKMMIDKGASDFNLGIEGAFESKKFEIVKFMITEGSAKGVIDFNSCLSSACLHGNLELVEIALENGANEFNYALMNACGGDHIELVRLMIECGATNLNECLGSVTARIQYDVNIYLLLITKGATDVSRMWFIDDYKIYSLYCKIGKANKIRLVDVSDDRKIKLLQEYPPCVLYNSAKRSKSYNCIQKLPDEMFTLLSEF